MIQQNHFKDLKEFGGILFWVVFFVGFLIVLHAHIVYVDVTVHNHRAGYEVDGQRYEMYLPARQDGEVLQWAYLSFYPKEHMRKDDVQFWVSVLLCSLLFPTMLLHMFLCNQAMKKHSRDLQSWGVKIQGKYIRHWTRRVKRSRQHVAEIDFNGVQITTKRHSYFIHDYSNCVAYVNPHNPQDYTILVNNEIIE